MDSLVDDIIAQILRRAEVKIVARASMMSSQWRTAAWACQTSWTVGGMVQFEAPHLLQQILPYLKNIKHLEICFSQIDSSVRELISTSRLKSLVFSDVPSLTAAEFSDMMKHTGATLNRISISGRSGIEQGSDSPSVFQIISVYCPNLRYLSISGNVSAVGLEQLATSCKQLEHLSLPANANIASVSKSSSLKVLVSSSQDTSQLIRTPFMAEGSMAYQSWLMDTSSFNDDRSHKLKLSDAVQKIKQIAPMKVGLNLAGAGWEGDLITILWQALREKAPTKVLEYLLQNGADVNFFAQGYTTFGAFGFAEELDMAKWLIHAGADPTLPAYGRRTAFEHYIYRYNVPCLRYLLSDEVWPRFCSSSFAPFPEFGNPLLYLVGNYKSDDLNGFIETLNFLLEPDVMQRVGYSIDDRVFCVENGQGNKRGTNCIHLACKRKVPPGLIRRLVAAGADPLAVGPDGVLAPIVFASISIPFAEDYEKNVVGSMLRYYEGKEDLLPPAWVRPGPDQPNFLCLAWKMWQVDLIKALLPRIKTREEFLALMAESKDFLWYALRALTSQDEGEIVLYLLSHEWIPETILNGGIIPPLYAARGYPCLVEALLKAGATPAGRVCYAIGQFEVESIKLLLSTNKIDLTLVSDDGLSVFFSALDSTNPVEKLDLIWDAAAASNIMREELLRIKSQQGNTVLHSLIECDKPSWEEKEAAAKWLIAHGIDCYATNENGITAGILLREKFGFDESNPTVQQMLDVLEPEGLKIEIQPPLPAFWAAQKPEFGSAVNLDALFASMMPEEPKVNYADIPDF